MPYLEQIWETRILTNGGPLHQRLEKELADYLGVNYVCLFNNGTNALMIAVQALGLKGEVITTPFSFVATANALVWNGVTPVFVDIDPGTFNLDPAKIEDAITPETTGILPVHCFGRPCDTGAIEQIARKHGLKVLYDAAHAFGVTTKGQSILKAGDLSVLSFHATKVFNTFEGGAVICHDEATNARLSELRNFGLSKAGFATDVGLNGKMNEFQAAVGLLQLDRVDSLIAARSDVARRYERGLSELAGIRLPISPADVQPNHAYYPVVVDNEFPMTRDELHAHLISKGIHARPYFWPLITTMEPYSFEPKNHTGLPVAHDVAQRILCLPMHAELTSDDVDRVIAAVVQK